MCFPVEFERSAVYLELGFVAMEVDETHSQTSVAACFVNLGARTFTEGGVAIV